MSIQASVGSSRLSTSFDAGRQAAAAAVDDLGGATPNLVLVFATSEHDQQKPGDSRCRVKDRRIVTEDVRVGSQAVGSRATRARPRVLACQS